MFLSSSTHNSLVSFKNENKKINYFLVFNLCKYFQGQNVMKF